MAEFLGQELEAPLDCANGYRCEVAVRDAGPMVEALVEVTLPNGNQRPDDPALDPVSLKAARALNEAPNTFPTDFQRCGSCILDCASTLAREKAVQIRLPFLQD